MKKIKKRIAVVLSLAMACSMIPMNGLADPLTPPTHDGTHTDLTYTKNAGGTHSVSCNFTDCVYTETDTPCTYDQENANDEYLKSAAACNAKAVYYKSCVCGNFDNTNEDPSNIFESGDYAAHTGGTADCQNLAECSECSQPYGEYGAHTENVAATATTTSKARCLVCNQEYGKMLNKITSFTLNGNDLLGTDPVQVEYSDAITVEALSANGTPAVTYYDSANTLLSSVPTELGTYSVKAEAAETADYDIATETKTFEIIKAEVDIVPPVASAINSSELLGSSILRQGAATRNGVNIPGTFAWKFPGKDMSRGTFSEEVIFTPADSNYAEKTINVNVTVKSTQQGGGNGGGAFGAVINQQSFVVKFESNGGSAIANQTVVSGQSARMPIPPTRGDADFVGWYSDAALTVPYIFTKKVTSDITLYAKWTDGDVIILRIGSTEAEVFGEKVVNDVPPIIRNDRTMLPARFVAEALGATVEWNPDTKVVTITKGETVIIITIDSAVATVNGVEEVLDSPAFIENDRTYTPLRFICEKLGARVEWDPETKTVTIYK